MLDMILTLSDKKPLFEGLTRSVYVHYQNPDYLIKIPTNCWKDKFAGFSNFRRWRKSVDLNTPNTKELAEFMRHFPDQSACEKHVMQIVGITATDLGWGLIVKAEYDAVGNLAKPFDAYKNNMKQYEEQITDFITWIRQTDFICYDLKFDNILLSWRSGQPQLVLIDGIGENGLFSMRKYCRRFNNFRNRKELQEFIDSLKPYIQLPCFDE